MVEIKIKDKRKGSITLYTIEEAAEILGCNRITLYRQIDSGRIDAITIRNRQYMLCDYVVEQRLEELKYRKQLIDASHKKKKKS